MTHSNSPFLHDGSLGDLYREHHLWLREWLRRKLGCSETAADLAQDTFVRLLTRPYSIENSETSRRLLSTVAKGLCIDLWRKRRIEAAWLEALSNRPELEAPSPESQLLVIEALCQVDAMLHKLPKKVASAFLLAQVDGLTYRAIAERLEVSERMVKKYMAQAMLHCLLIESHFHS